MITTMRTPRRGEIYYIDKNPYRTTIGSVQEPGRPAIIVSNNANNAHALTFEIVYLTTAPKKDLPTHCTIRSTKLASTALCEQITTISNEQLKDYYCTCTEEEMRMVDSCMAISLGLDFEDEDEPEYVQTTTTTATSDETEYAEGDEDDTESLYDEIDRLHTDLIKAEKEAEIYKAMYESLLERMLK